MDSTTATSTSERAPTTFASRPADPDAPTQRPDPFTLLVLAGIGLVALGQVITMLTVIGDLPGEMVAPTLFGVFGTIAIGVGLALAGALGQHLPAGGRIALLIGGAYFTTSGGILNMFAGFFGSIGSMF